MRDEHQYPRRRGDPEIALTSNAYDRLAYSRLQDEMEAFE